MSEISILDFDQVAASETPFEFELKNAAGDRTGVFLSVLGDDAPVVHKFTTRRVNEDRRHQLVRQKSRKQDEYTPIEDDISYAIEAALVRLVAWRGLKDPFSPENARTLITRSRDVRAQVMEESAKPGNFLQRKG